MSLLKFDDCVFNTDSYKLTYKSNPVPLRPKALRLLHLLITNRDRVVLKSEIFSTVWGSSYARDHLLFQLISELRKAPFSNGYVRTQPNQGYQWNVKTLPLTGQSPRRLSIAACFMMMAIGLSASSVIFSPNSSLNTTAHLPAQSALVKGIIALDLGQNDEAIRWFKFAVNENPASFESSLFLAESLFQQNRTDESLTQIERLLKTTSLDPYNRMTINDLLSRINLSKGNLNEALKYAIKSSNDGVAAQCSVDVIDQRINILTDSLNTPKFGRENTPSELSKSDLVSGSESASYDDECQQLNNTYDETSLCIPVVKDDYYAVRHKKRLLIFS